MAGMTREDAEALDRSDPLGFTRARFALPEDIVYLDGNSLGPLTVAARERVADVVSRQWGEGLIRSWNVHDWIDLPSTVAARIAPLIGAPAGSVAVADSTSVNIFKALAMALELRPGRRTILTQTGNFPTDIYIARGLADLVGGGHRVVTVDEDRIEAALGADVAVLMLTEVNYRTGARLDMAHLTAQAHRHGALSLWDLAHSAGALPVELAAADADFAVGCGYKFLNGGPGAPAFIHVAPRHMPGLRQPLTGWLGHDAPFAFAEDYRPSPTIEAMRVGTPPILSLSALDAALSAFDGVALAALKAKADKMIDIFVARVGELAPELEVLTPTDPARRGSQVSLRHPQAYAVMQALIGRGVIGDFREPDILRFGFAPLYNRHLDAWTAASTLGNILAGRLWDRPELKTRAKVV